ncbi:MAG: glutathione S-transferase family protein [Proteobacteria bacterium]|nr:glutathione S-transferase family protein [Pseudomonadota bacterium]
MKLYNSIGPNPRTVRMFAAEKGIELPKVELDLMAGENRQPAHMARNPSGTTPALELDNGTILAEITAICEYLDEIKPGTSLIGKTPEERAETRMWTRRIDLNIVETMSNGFRYGDGFKLFEKRVHCIPQAADDLKQIAQEKLAWLDGQMAGKTYVCGARLSLADILLFAFVDFFQGFGQPLNPALKNIGAWYTRMKARPSAAA